MLVRLFTLVGILGCVDLSLGCAGQPRVAVITSTMVGLEAKPPMGDAQPNPSVSLGYRRAEMTLVPVCQVTEYDWSKDFKKQDGTESKAVKKKDDAEETPANEKPNPQCPPKASKDADAYAAMGSFQMAHNWFGPLNIRQFIATGMAARHLVTPTVSVIGEVNNPGRYPFTKGLTVDQAIGLAGNRTKRANPDTIEILRQANAHQDKIEGNAKTVLTPDDILNVAEAHWFHISGEVKTPGRYLHKEGMTIEKAIKDAGGPTAEGKQGKSKATRVRKDDQVSERRELDVNAPVLPDDIIVVEPAVAQPSTPSKN